MPVDINGTTGVTTPALASTAMPTSGGEPVVGSGSNSDGWWIRFADGAQICHGLSAANASYAPHGNVFSSSVPGVTYPAPFSTPPHVSEGTRKTTGSDSVWAGDQSGQTATGYTPRVVFAASEARGYVIYTANGRWK